MKAQEILERLENITKKYFSTSEAKIEYIFYLFSRKQTKEIVFPYESDKETNKVHLSSGCSANIQLLSPALAFFVCLHLNLYRLTNEGAFFLIKIEAAGPRPLTPVGSVYSAFPMSR